MKLSLKLKEEESQQQQSPLLKAKIPMTILSYPFTSTLTTTTTNPTKDLSLNLTTNNTHFPSLRLTYTPTPTNPSSFSISLKSGVGLFGSPNDSPLVISAKFNPFSGNMNPCFSLEVKPVFGDFSFKKRVVSDGFSEESAGGEKGKGEGKVGGDFYDSVVRGRWPVVDLGEKRSERFFEGTALTAKTVLPVTKRAEVKFRWGVNFPKEFVEARRLPFLTVDKISIERLFKNKEDIKTEKAGDLEVLKGMCFWMRNEVDVLQKENRAMRECIEDVRTRSRVVNGGENENVSKLSATSTGTTPGFEQWKKSKKNEGQNSGGSREVKKASGSESPAGDLGEELKRAIQAASSV